MKRVTLRYGIDRIEKSVPEGTTIAQLVNDENIRGSLGYGDNVKATHNGIQMPMEAVAPPAELGEVVIETAANSKAVVL